MGKAFPIPALRTWKDFLPAQSVQVPVGNEDSLPHLHPYHSLSGGGAMLTRLALHQAQL